MASDVTALYTLCLERTVELLKDHYWNPEVPVDENPFRFLPSVVIDELLVHAVDEMIRSPNIQPSSVLRLLIKSGKLRDFRLCGHGFNRDIQKMDFRTFRKIMFELASSCSSLRSITITMVNYWNRIDKDIRDFNYILRQARNIRHVDSNVYFNIRALRDSDRLETLVMNFPLTRNSICDFLRVNRQFRPHAFLREFMVVDYQPYSYSEVAIILKYCPQLTSTNCDISQSLEHLHAEEWRNGCLTHTYKIRKCRLGRTDSFNFDFIASSDSVRIAALTCPFLQELNLTVGNNEDFSALGDCRNFDCLTVHSIGDGDPNKSLQRLLEKPGIGHRLKALKIEAFTNIDFTSIGMCCSNLERLVVCRSVNSSGDILPNIFEKLQSLKMWYFSEFKVAIELMCSAPNLKHMEFMPRGDDRFTGFDTFTHAFTDILSKNKLSILKHIKLFILLLSLDGWRNLVRSLKALESVDLILYTCDDSDEVEAVQAVFREINPRVSVNLLYTY